MNQSNGLSSHRNLSVISVSIIFYLIKLAGSQKLSNFIANSSPIAFLIVHGYDVRFTNM